MYNVGDLILYGNTGVCEIMDISYRSLPGSHQKQLYYTLNPLYQECIIYAPADNPKVFMRPVIAKDEAERLIDMIPSLQVEAYHSRVLSELSQHYENSMKTHSCADLIELTMSIYAKKRHADEQKRKFGAVDERFMKRAEELLFGELAVALDINREDVPHYIAERVKNISGHANSACDNTSS